MSLGPNIDVTQHLVYAISNEQSQVIIVKGLYQVCAHIYHFISIYNMVLNRTRTFTYRPCYLCESECLYFPYVLHGPLHSNDEIKSDAPPRLATLPPMKMLSPVQSSPLISSITVSTWPSSACTTKAKDSRRRSFQMPKYRTSSLVSLYFQEVHKPST